MNEAAFDPSLRAANIRLGLWLGAFVVATIVGLMLLFGRNGLPKSPEIWKEMEQERSAVRAPQPSDAPAVAPASEPAATPAGEEKR